jgi:hypothetical protein
LETKIIGTRERKNTRKREEKGNRVKRMSGDKREV